MQLPSLHRLLSEAARVARRFPLTLLCAAALCAIGIYFQRLDHDQRDELRWLFPGLSAAGLGLTLTLTVALAGERYRWPVWARVLGQSGAVALLAAWYAACPAEPGLVWGLRLVLLLVALHLLVAAVPYLPELRRQADTPGFWRYNETLFLRILTAGLYSGVLFVGCALALLAVENLFGLHLGDRWYGHLFTVLATVFNTWFFLAGVPADLAALEQAVPYPKGLKLFTQFVLLPLVVLYLVILYAYLGRIVLAWELPKGWVSVLVLAFSVAGIFALLLIHPIRDAAENTWVRTFARWFYRALFPLLGLLAVAIGTRVRQYGITEERYFVLVLAGWLGLMAAYFLWRQGRGIVWVPASLALVALLSAFGPWSAFAVAERSQLGRLRELAAQYQLLHQGRLDGAGQRVPNLPRRVQQRLTSLFDFFAERDNLAAVQPFFAASLALPDSLHRRPAEEWRQRQWLRHRPFEISGLPRVEDGEGAAAAKIQTANFRPADDQFIQLSPGYYWLRNLNNYDRAEDDAASVDTFAVAEGVFRLRHTKRGTALYLERRTGPGRWQPVLRLSPAALADSLARTTRPTDEYSTQVPDLSLRARRGPVQLRVVFGSLQRIQRPNQPPEYTYDANAFMTVAPQP